MGGEGAASGRARGLGECHQFGGGTLGVSRGLLGSGCCSGVPSPGSARGALLPAVDPYCNKARVALASLPRSLSPREDPSCSPLSSRGHPLLSLRLLCSSPILLQAQVSQPVLQVLCTSLTLFFLALLDQFSQHDPPLRPSQCKSLFIPTCSSCPVPVTSVKRLSSLFLTKEHLVSLGALGEGSGQF